MAHVFFEPLEKRQSTQTLFPSLGSDIVAIYSAPIAEYAVGIPGGSYYGGGYYPSQPALLYGINFPNTGAGGYYPWSNPFGGYSYGGFPFGGSFYGGYSSYNPYSMWSNPFGGYNSWGFGNIFSPFRNIFQGLFGGLFGSSPWQWQQPYPNIQPLYGVTPVYGISITPSPIDVVTYYGISVPSAQTSFGFNLF